jgi:DNA-binding CsgD family transcriptional regulator
MTRTRRVTHGPLTEGEFDVLRLIAEGMQLEEIGRELWLSKRAVVNRLTRVRRALGARNTPHAVGLGYRIGVLKPDAPAEATP